MLIHDALRSPTTIGRLGPRPSRSRIRSPFFGLSRFTDIRDYNLTNANIGYRFADGTELIVWARNLLDADYIQNVTIQAGNSGLVLGTPSDPRTIGGTLRFQM